MLKILLYLKSSIVLYSLDQFKYVTQLFLLTACRLFFIVIIYFSILVHIMNIFCLDQYSNRVKRSRYMAVVFMRKMKCQTSHSNPGLIILSGFWYVGHQPISTLVTNKGRERGNKLVAD